MPIYFVFPPTDCDPISESSGSCVVYVMIYKHSDHLTQASGVPARAHPQCLNSRLATPSFKQPLQNRVLENLPIDFYL